MAILLSCPFQELMAVLTPPCKQILLARHPRQPEARSGMWRASVHKGFLHAWMAGGFRCWHSRARLLQQELSLGVLHLPDEAALECVGCIDLW